MENLKRAPLLELLDDEEWRAMLALSRRERFEAGTEIFSRGEPGDSLFIVRSGRVKIVMESDAGEEVVLNENNPGDVFGEISLFDGGPRTATAIADTDTELFLFDRERLLGFLSKYPHAALDLMSVMGSRLRATDELLRTRISRNPNVEEEDHLTFGQRVADRVAEFGGSWTFILTFGVVLVAWVSLNVALAERAFDVYPFILLNLFLSMLAALQAPVIMMSQNRVSAKDRMKAELDYQINLKAELEVAHLHRNLEKLQDDVKALLQTSRERKG